jgi:predicted lysophospholipase L1 biosynthesis ABC-type transport system permease subunit
LDTRVGETVELTATKGSRPFVVTGSGMVPNGAHNHYADGGWVTDGGYDSLFDSHKFHLAYVALRPDARTPDAAQSLTAALARTHPKLAGVEFGPPDPLTELFELRQVRILPILLGVLLAVLAVGAVGHALATAVRRRSHDLAVLRALGMTQWQCRWAVVTQATVLAVVGLVFGVPIGLAVGRSVWRAITDYTPLQYVPPTALTTMLLVGPVALLVANALAAWPARRAARMQISRILRAE